MGILKGSCNSMPHLVTQEVDPAFPLSNVPSVLCSLRPHILQPSNPLTRSALSSISPKPHVPLAQCFINSMFSEDIQMDLIFTFG